jgi:hypothetical protein
VTTPKSSALAARAAVRRTCASAAAATASIANAGASNISQTTRAASNGSRASTDHNGNDAAGPANGNSSSRVASTPGIVRSVCQMSRDHGSPPAFQVAPAA